MVWKKNLRRSIRSKVTKPMTRTPIAELKPLKGQRFMEPEQDMEIEEENKMSINPNMTKESITKRDCWLNFMKK